MPGRVGIAANSRHRGAAAPGVPALFERPADRRGGWAVAGVTSRWCFGNRRINTARIARSPSPAAASDPPAQYRDLVAQHQQLGVLGRSGPGEHNQPADDPGEEQVEQAQRHLPRSSRGHVDSDVPPYRRRPQTRADLWNPQVPAQQSPARVHRDGALLKGRGGRPTATSMTSRRAARPDRICC